MANFTDRIKLIFDVDKNAGTSALKNFGNDFRTAEGFSNKFKVAAGGAMDYAKEHAAQLAAVGGAAIVAFGVKALGAFEDTAKAALDMGTATGLSTEQASRWIAVGDDYKVAGDTITKSLVQIVKTLDASKWAEFGIATKDAGGELRSTNDLLIDGLSALSGITDATAQAEAGQKLFGKAFKDLSPLLGHTRDEYEKMLGSVEDGQVITDAEAKKAEKMRLAQDQLADALHEVTLKVGEEVASLAPLVVQLVKILELIDKIGALNPFQGVDTSSLTDRLDEITKAAIESGDAVAYLTERGFGAQAQNLIARYISAQKEAASTTKTQTGALKEAADAHVAASRETGRLADDTKIATEAQIAFSHALDDAAGVVGDAKDGYHQAATAASAMGRALDDLGQDSDDLTSSLRDQIQALKDLRDEAQSAIDKKYAFESANRDAAAAIRDFNAVTADSESTMQDVDNAAFDAGESIRNAAKAYAESTGAAEGSVEATKAQIDYLDLVSQSLAPGSPLRQRVDGYKTDLEGIPTSVTTKVGIGNYDDTVEKLRSLKRQLDDLNRTRNASINLGSSPQTTTPAGRGQGFAGRGASNQGISAGPVIWNGTEWVPQAAIDEGTQVVDDAAAHAKEIADNKNQYLFDTGKKSLEDYIAYLEAENAGDEEYSSSWLARQRDIDSARQAFADSEAAKAEAAAEAVKKAEKEKQDAIQATIDKEAERQRALDDAAGAQADLEVAAQKQAAAVARLELLQKAVAGGGQGAIDAAPQIAQAEADAAAATLAGAEARAKAMGLTPGSAAYNAQVQSDVAAYIAQHPNLGGGFGTDLQQLVKAIPSADDYAAAMARILVPALVQAMQGVSVALTPAGVQAITAEQQRRLAGNT